MKKQQTAPQKTMLQALQDLRADGQTKSAAYYFLKADFSRLESEDSFTATYHGLLCAQQLLGPMHPDFQKSLVEMRKALDSFARRFQVEAFREAAFFRIEVEELWLRLLETTRNHMPYQDWCKFYKDGQEVFGKER